MTYLDPVLVIILVIAGLLAAKFASHTQRTVVLLVICLVYFSALIYFTLISRSEGYSGYTEVSLVPFRAFRRSFSFDPGLLGVIRILFTDGFQAARQAVHVDSIAAIRGIFLNVLLFVPFGYLLPTIAPRFRCWWKVILTGLSVSFLIELVQMFTGLGQFDLDDIITNLIGLAIGWLLWLLALKPREPKGKKIQSGEEESS